MKDIMTFGERIKDLRKKKKLTQKELAYKLGIDHTTVSKWESDVYEPDIDTIHKLADLFGVTTYYLLNKSEENVDIFKIFVRGRQLVIKKHFKNEKLTKEEQKELDLFNSIPPFVDDPIEDQNKTSEEIMVKTIKDEIDNGLESSDIVYTDEEKRLMDDLDRSADEIKEKYNPFVVDGELATKEEIEAAIAYIKMLRITKG